MNRTHRQRPCLLSSTSCSSSRNSSDWIVLSRDMITSPTSWRGSRLQLLRRRRETESTHLAQLPELPRILLSASPPPTMPRDELTCLLAIVSVLEKSS